MQSLKSKLQKEKQIIQKRQQLNETQDEKIKHMEDENQELKKAVKLHQTEILRKNQQLENHDGQIQKLLLEKQYMEQVFK